MALGSDIGLLFNIKADGSQATQEIKKVISAVESAGKVSGKEMFDDFAKSVGLSEDKAKELSAATVLGSALTTIAGVATGAGTALFALAKNTADYGSQIHDIAEATNFSTETISALKLAAEQSGTSIEAVSGGLGKFSKLMGQANDGNKAAIATLKEYGLTAKTALADPEAALQKVVARIHELKGSQDQIILTQRTFGKGASDLIPVINTTNGKLAEYIENGKKLGLVLSQEDANAADAFGDSLGELQQAVRGVSQVFAREFLPDITRAMGSLENLLLDNKKQFKEWGEYVSDIIRGVSTPDNASLPKPPSQSAGLLGDRPDWFPSDQDVVKFLMDNSSTGNLARTLSGENAAKRGAQLRQQEDRQNQGILEGEYRDPNYGQPPDVTSGNKAPGISPDTSRAKKEADTAERKAAEAKKKALEAETKTWDSKTLAEFAKNQGFVAGSGYVQGGHNENSLHYLNRALDVKLGASDPNRSVEDVTKLMANAIESGIRIVDERVRPPGEKVWTAPHVHLEENKTKGSYFNPSLDYGGKIEYLKALDKERLAGKGKTVAQALDPKASNEQAIRDREAFDNRVLELDKSKGEQSKADLDQQLAKKEISEQDYADKVAQIAIDALEKEKKLLEDRLKLTQLNAEQRAEIQGKIDNLTSDISVKNTEKATEKIKDQNKEFERQYQINLEIAELRKQVTDAQQQTTDYEKDQERIRLQNDVDNSYGKDRLTALVILQHFEIAEADRKHQVALDNLDAEEKREIEAIEKRAKDDVKFTEDAEKEKAAIRDKYASNRQQEDDQNDATHKGIDKQYNPQINDEQTKSGSGVAGHAADILGNIAGGVSATDSEGKIKSQADLMKGVYADLAQSSDAAIGSMVSGLGDLVQQWIVTGKFSVRAAAQMVAGILASLAIEDGIKALHEYAEGVAMASNPITAPFAAGHFAAAVAYGTVAAEAGAGAAAVGLLSRAGGGGSSSQSFAGASSPNSSTNSLSSNTTDTATKTESRKQSEEADRKRTIEILVKNTHEMKPNGQWVTNSLLNDIGNMGDGREAIVRLINENS